MSLPYCLTNPTLRALTVSGQLYTVEKLKGEQFYALHREGINYGLVFRRKSMWCVEAPGRNYNPASDRYASRQRAFEALVQEYINGRPR